MLRFFTLLLLAFMPLLAWGNGLRIWPGPPAGVGRTSAWVGWENGWNDTDVEGGNHDAVWLYAKQSGLSGGQHLHPTHVTIQQNGSYFQSKVSSDERGIWLYPMPGRAFTIDSALLEIEFQEELSGIITLRGVEMVFIPSAPFFLGDSVSNNSLYAFSSEQKAPIRVSSDGRLALNGVGGVADGIASDTGHLALEFPLGFDAFFCQKYEISQSQWADFLNALGSDQVSSMYPTALPGTLPTELAYKRGTLIVDNEGGYKATAPHRAAGGISNKDLLAFLDWACLRPMTESEFEKVCRGPLHPVMKEFAWGNCFIQTPDSMQADGSDGEHPAGLWAHGKGWANHARFVGESYLGGPTRQGFAANTTSGRIESGAGYYGCFELSGNVWELCVRLSGNNSLTTATGDGILNGFLSNETQWTSLPFIVRGGGHASVIIEDTSYPFRDLAISDRFYLSYDGSQRRSTTGGRGIRGW